MCRLSSIHLILALLLPLCGRAETVPVPVVTTTNVTFRVMAANLTSGNFSRYETPGLNILKALKPDLVCIQEFNYASTTGKGTDTPAAIREMVTNTFGTNFTYYREPYTNNGDIPNGIISRWPISSSGSWDDPEIPNRGFAWARIDLPGTNDLYAVSVHLKANDSSDAVRASEATVLKSNILAQVTTNAAFMIAGDFNLFYSDPVTAITTLTSIAADKPVPADQAGDPDTNAGRPETGRTERYDRILVSPNYTNRQVPVVIGANRFTNGLVFDSRVYSPLSNVPPVLAGDSGASNMQHMAVVKDFQISYLVTNVINVIVPKLTMNPPGALRWSGTTGLTYSVQSKTNLAIPGWPTVGTVTSATTNFAYTNNSGATRYFRVTYP